jgi:hypothetical protein
MSIKSLMTCQYPPVKTGDTCLLIESRSRLERLVETSETLTQTAESLKQEFLRVSIEAKFLPCDHVETDGHGLDRS